MSSMEKLEQELNLALVTLNSFAIRGPLIVPIGKAMESVSRALGMVQELCKESEDQTADEKAEEGKGEGETDEASRHEVQ